MIRLGTLARSLTAAVALSVLAAPAVADPPTPAELAQARERFSAARKLEEAGRWGEALALLQRVAEVKMTPQVRFHLALCMENVGQWTKALEAYALAVSEAGTSAPEVVQESNDHARRLEDAMPTMTLVVVGAGPDDILTLHRRRIPIDGGPLALRVDPGTHTVEVQRAGVTVATQSFAIEARATRRVELRVEPPQGLPPNPPPPPPPKIEPAPTASASAAPTAAPTSPPPRPKPPEGRAQRIAGWSLIGAGGASLFVAGVFIGLRAGALSRLEGACPGFAGCARSVAPIVSEGKTDAALVNVFAIAGGLGAATGLTLLLTAPSARIDVAPSAGGLAIFARGAF